MRTSTHTVTTGTVNFGTIDASFQDGGSAMLCDPSRSPHRRIRPWIRIEITGVSLGALAGTSRECLSPGRFGPPLLPLGLAENRTLYPPHSHFLVAVIMVESQKMENTMDD